MRSFPHLTIAPTLAVVCRAVGLMFVAAAQSGAASVATPNYQGLWSNAPAESESGSGIKFAHQGDTIFATWVTYDFDGSVLWLSATAAKGERAFTPEPSTAPPARRSTRNPSIPTA